MTRPASKSADLGGSIGRAGYQGHPWLGVRVIKTAVRAPNMNPIGERFVGSLRREALDHVLLLAEDQLHDVAQQYVLYFNKARPDQGIGQRIPDGPGNDNRHGNIVAIPVLSGLHHDYRRAA